MSDHPTEDEDRTFNIIRFYSDDRDSKIIKTGLTREEAMEWCSRDDTHKVGEWFDGFRDTALDEA